MGRVYFNVHTALILIPEAMSDGMENCVHLGNGGLINVVGTSINRYEFDFGHVANFTAKKFIGLRDAMNWRNKLSFRFEG